MPIGPAFCEVFQGHLHEANKVNWGQAQRMLQDRGRGLDAITGAGITVNLLRPGTGGAAAAVFDGSDQEPATSLPSLQIVTGTVRSSLRYTLCFFAGAASAEDSDGQGGGGGSGAVIEGAERRGDRAAMLRVLRSHQGTMPCRMHVISPEAPAAQREYQTDKRSLWKESPTPMEPKDYASALSTSILALVPGGNNPETFRHWEAWEAGAIPVAVEPLQDRSYLRKWCMLPANQSRTLEGPPGETGSSGPLAPFMRMVNGRRCPLLMLQTWDDLPRLIETLARGLPEAQDEAGAARDAHASGANAEAPQGEQAAAGGLHPDMAPALDLFQEEILRWLVDYKTQVAGQVAALVR